jgi:protein-S-isoprenylcysteine O-methyltransferase Ste14
MLQIVALTELALCWAAWSLAFVAARIKSGGQKKVTSAPASRWGIVLETVGFAMAWAYVRPAGFEKSAPALIASMILGPPSVALAWAATRHLGKYWRLEAALSEHHELVRTGPYRFVRHPIYASMFGMFVTTLLARTWWPMSVAALVFFIAGTEVRVRAEDRLLAGRFQEAFNNYKMRVRAYVPLVR